MPWAARKQMTLEGVRYAAGDLVPMDGLRPGVRQRLLEYRRVVPRDTRPSAGPQPLPGPAVAGAQPHTCGWYGGRTKNGKPCGRPAKGLCEWHDN